MVQVEIIHTTFRRTLPPELAYLDQNLFSYGASPFPGEADHIAVTQWETRLEECRACAAVLRRHAMEGMRLRDMAIACGDEKSYGALLSSVMEEMGLPLISNEMSSADSSGSPDPAAGAGMRRGVHGAGGSAGLSQNQLLRP